MDKEAAKRLIHDTLKQKFDKERYVFFIKNLLNKIDESKAFLYAGQYVPEKFRDFVKSYERIGTYTDPEGRKTDVLIVNLKNELTLARARTSQRNFIANYLKNRDEKDAGLIAFVSPNAEDWRFSFVKMDYRLVEKKGEMRPEEEFTPAKRYSFLVGAQESSHTAQQQLFPILVDDEHNPTLDVIEKAFSIETVTKEFFEKYRELFLQVKEALDVLVLKDKAIRSDFEQKGVNTADFSKKLLGQIVFLYFLQKKGWFGVERDAEWGSGPKNFLRQLFKGEMTTYKNFFNDVLESLFYEALATPRDENFYSKFDCKIPFLNGGLFDPINGYDWIHTDITLPNDLFSNGVRDAKTGDTGTGILDMFDRYNFTVKEDEPLEKEVAVDPEMLGKVFENLLEVKDRKSKGTYYTPREIVHYMCQESLINFIFTELGDSVPREDISLFIHIGDTVAEHESRVVSKGKETSSYTHKLPESIRRHAEEIDRKLQNIRVCDPAIGSGAFPVGMMNEIVRARQTLTIYLGGNDDRTPYDFKRHAIQECLYGVDIDPGAVEIAKLRLWLSLVVDEDDIGHIKPLPNLDYRIMQGNSLLEEYEGIKLFDEKLLGKDAECIGSELESARQQVKNLQKEYFALNSEGKLTNARKKEIETEIKQLQKIEKQLTRKPDTEKMTGMFDAPSQAKEMYEKLKKLHQDFFGATQREKKKKLKEQIENLEWELIETSLQEQGRIKTLDELMKLKNSNLRPFFLWRLHFVEVFKEKNGFDIVMANPPYVRADSGEEYLVFRKELEESGAYNTLYEKWDLMVPFIERGVRISNSNGNLIYIVSDAICTSKYASKLIDFIQESYFTYSIDYFEDIKVFDAGVMPVVINIGGSRLNGKTRKIIRNNSFENISQETHIDSEEFKSMGRNAFRKDFKPLTIDIDTIELGDICYISYGLRPNSDERYWKGEFTAKDIISKSKDKIHSKLYVEGKDIENYHINRVRYLEWGTDRVPKKLVRPTFPELYDRTKLMRGILTGGIIDSSGIVCNHSVVVFIKFFDLQGVKNKSIQMSIKKFNKLDRDDLENISSSFDLKYLLAILNSSFANTYLNNIRRHRMENYFYPDDYRKLPIAKISPEEQQKFVTIVNDILSAREKDINANTSVLENEIDQMVDNLYNIAL